MYNKETNNWFQEHFNKPLTKTQQNNLKKLYKPPMTIRKLYDLQNYSTKRQYFSKI